MHGYLQMETFSKHYMYNLGWNTKLANNTIYNKNMGHKIVPEYFQVNKNLKCSNHSSKYTHQGSIFNKPNYS
jgi:hypothetical protein